FIKKWLVK
ncbi:hypothetical protein ACTFIU_001992, partial [Dictyostelium citrinum]